jgi:hypothetical protein
MKRYLVAGFLMIVPLYGISKATAELVKSMGSRNETPALVKPQVIAKLDTTLNSQFIKTVE